MKTRRVSWLLAGAIAVSAGFSFAQFAREGRRMFRGGDAGPIVRTEGGYSVNEDTVRTARETAPQVDETPVWTNSIGFEWDTFVYARLLFHSPGRPALMGWLNDYPDSDLNLSYRLQQLTSMKVDPDGRVIKLTDPELFNYPLLIASQPGGIEFSEDEAAALRRYLLNGGVLWLDDCWGTRDWDRMETQLKRILPERPWTELPVGHPLFHCVFDFKGPMNNLQTPSIHFWRRNYDPDNPSSLASAKRGAGSEDMHVRAWLDEHDRIMILATNNTDNGDGWEREGENVEFFHLFSEKRSYPFAVNLIFYLMTH